MQADKKATKILARSFFAQLRQGGYNPQQVLDVATELLDLVTDELKQPREQAQSSAELRQSA